MGVVGVVVVFVFGFVGVVVDGLIWLSCCCRSGLVLMIGEGLLDPDWEVMFISFLCFFFFFFFVLLTSLS
jgi:hypothetical protein